jgi:predicted outer membrane protein
VLVGAALFTVGLAAPAPALAAPPGWTDTPFGPLGPADRDMLVRVRLAGLWEAPAGRLAQERSENARVREVGGILEADHIALDVKVLAVADRLGVPMPQRSNPEQEGWLAELERRSGEAFDVLFTDLLRAAHGNVFSAVANVRAGSRNDAVREFAEEGVNVVMKHMTLLESTGLVNAARLTPPPAPPLARVPFSDRSGAGPLFVWIVLAVAVIAGALAIARVIRPR